MCARSVAAASSKPARARKSLTANDDRQATARSHVVDGIVSGAATAPEKVVHHGSRIETRWWHPTLRAAEEREGCMYAAVAHWASVMHLAAISVQSGGVLRGGQMSCPSRARRDAARGLPPRPPPRAARTLLLAAAVPAARRYGTSSTSHRTRSCALGLPCRRPRSVDAERIGVDNLSRPVPQRVAHQPAPAPATTRSPRRSTMTGRRAFCSGGSQSVAIYLRRACPRRGGCAARVRARRAGATRRR